MSACQSTAKQPVKKPSKKIKAGAVKRNIFPSDGLFKLNTVVLIVDVGKSTWLGWVKDGFAPRPIKIGCNTFWRGKDIWTFIEGVCK